MPQLFTTTTIKSTSKPLLSVDTEQIRKIDNEQQEMLFNLQNKSEATFCHSYDVI